MQLCPILCSVEFASPSVRISICSKGTLTSSEANTPNSIAESRMQRATEPFSNRNEQWKCVSKCLIGLIHRNRRIMVARLTPPHWRMHRYKCYLHAAYVPRYVAQATINEWVTLKSAKNALLLLLCRCCGPTTNNAQATRPLSTLHPSTLFSVPSSFLFKEVLCSKKFSLAKARPVASSKRTSRQRQCWSRAAYLRHLGQSSLSLSDLIVGSSSIFRDM